jgi:hypothetical protein
MVSFLNFSTKTIRTNGQHAFENKFASPMSTIQLGAKRGPQCSSNVIEKDCMQCQDLPEHIQTNHPENLCAFSEKILMSLSAREELTQGKRFKPAGPRPPCPLGGFNFL